MILKKFQDLGDMLKMSFPRFTVDEDVVKEYEDEGLKIRLRYGIHESLEGGGCIAKAKRPNQKLIMALMGTKSYLGIVCFFDVDLMVS